MRGKSRRRYSLEFKKKKIRELESGQTTVREIVELYGIHKSVIYNWKTKFGTYPKDEVLVIETESDFLKSQDLEKEIAKLKQLLGTAHIELSYWKEVCRSASEAYGEDVEKKFGGQ